MLFGIRDVQNFLKEKGIHTQVIKTSKYIEEPHTELLLLVDESVRVTDVGVEDIGTEDGLNNLLIVCDGFGGVDLLERPYVFTYAQLFVEDELLGDVATDVSVVIKRLISFCEFPQDSDEIAKDFINYLRRNATCQLPLG